MSQEKIYFPGLNGIRAIAASIVLIFHIDQYLILFGVPSFGYHKTGMAGYAVIMFFVLSGFLITYLLLAEKQKYKKIDLPKFYIRRILRIWPIYYLLIIFGIGLLIFGLNNIVGLNQLPFVTFLLYGLLLSNVGYGLDLGGSIITPLWSIGVEEQFYGMWPFLLNRSKNILRSILCFIAVYLLVKGILRVIENGVVYKTIWYTCFDAMGIGGIGAVMVYNKSKILRVVFHPAIQILAWLFLIYSIIIHPIRIANFIAPELHSLVYLVIILNVSSNTRSLIKLENAVFNFIGRISYGIYVYHMTVLSLIAYFLTPFLSKMGLNKYAYYSIIYISVISLSILTAYLSYTFFESRFLKFKTKFMKVKSTNSKDISKEAELLITHTTLVNQ